MPLPHKGGLRLHLTHGDITIRTALPEDAAQLCLWWNDGAVMAHAGYPLGLGTTVEKEARTLSLQRDETGRRHIIEYAGAPIGEMNYRNIGDNTAEIGIKICESDMQNKGLGKVILSLFIKGLFETMGFRKIVLDTNLNNTRAQHVYEQLGFRKLRVNIDSWTDQLGQKQSSVDYELYPQDLVSYLK